MMSTNSKLRTQHWPRSQAVRLLWLAASTGLGACVAQTPPPCFAFLLKADVIVECGGERTQVTHRGDIDQFAVSEEKLSLGFVTSQVTKRAAGEADAVYTATLVDLGSAKVTQITGQNALVNTCGGIFWAYDSRRQHLGNRELITGRDVDMAPNAWFRCSGDRAVVVGTVKKSGADLMETAPAQKRVAAAGTYNFFQFNVSPKGSRVVYTNDSRPLCVFSFAGPTECITPENATPDIPTVNDRGEVLVSTQTPEECFYKSSSNFSATRILGARRDACLGVGYWKPGLKSIQIIEPIGRNPQWISPTTAMALRDWASTKAKGPTVAPVR